MRAPQPKDHAALYGGQRSREFGVAKFRMTPGTAMIYSQITSTEVRAGKAEW